MNGLHTHGWETNSVLYAIEHARESSIAFQHSFRPHYEPTKQQVSFFIFLHRGVFLHVWAILKTRFNFAIVLLALPSERNAAR